MIYTLGFRKQVLNSLDDGMMFAQAVDFYNISSTTIQKWKKRIHSKITRQVKLHKVTDERLFKDVKDYPEVITMNDQDV